MDSSALTLKIIFSAPGRIRFRLTPEVEEIPNLDDILSIAGVKETAFNKLTKSLLIVYNRHILTMKELLAVLKQKLPRLTIIKKVKHHQEVKKELPSHQLYRWLRKINKEVAAKSKGQADMFSLALILSLTWGLEELIRNPVMPKWYDILRFSQSLFTEIEIEEEM